MSTSQQTDPLIGRLVDGRYRVRARIARGGMATVYVATDLRLERRIALKVMHGHLSDDTVFQSRFIQEARAAARLADPHVVNVFDQGQDGDMAYLVMEYLPGITLRELLREQRRLTVPQAISILDAVLSGLAAAHRAGIVHRDVKPENVLLAEDGRIKIGDFGLARATTANTASGAQLMGTIAYLAPELVTRGTADARSDIYALGIMLYEMLTGEQPYKGEQPMQIAFQHATDSVPRPSVKNPAIPEPLDELVLWATERSPDERPLDAREMLTRLREIERDLGVTPNVARTSPIGIVRDEAGSTGELTAVLPAALTGPTGPTATMDEVDNAARLRRATSRRRSRGVWLALLVVVLAALAGGAGWWFGSGPGSLVTVADVSGMTSFQEASDRLAQDSLTATEQAQSSLDVPAGTVIGTDPPAGSFLEREAGVTVLVSSGPAEAQVEALNGRSEEEVRGILESHVITVGDETPEYYTDAGEGVVVDVVVHPRAGGDDIACGDGCTVHEGDTATVSVSLGALADVSGMSADDAEATLSEYGVAVAARTEEFDDDVAEGRVIYMTERDGGGWWRPGDSTTLVVSKGPEPVEVPEVVGETVRTAVERLRGAGFTVAGLDAIIPAFWDLYRVRGIDPDEGELLRPGATVTVTDISLG